METCAREGCENPLPEKRRKTQKFCSVACTQLASNSRRKGPALPDRECAFCGESFSPIRVNMDYCGSRCYEAAYLLHRREARQQNADGIFGDKPNVIVRDIEDVREGEFAIYLADEHGEFWDQALCGAVDKVIADFQPARCFYGGDYGVDFYDISVFKKNPLKVSDIQSDLDHAHARFDYHHHIAPNMKRYYAAGNHENRFLRWCWDHPEVAPLRDEGSDKLMLTIPYLLGLEQRSIDYLDYPGRYKYAGFIVTHGPGERRAGLQIKMAAKWMAEHLHSSGVCFHFHTNQTYGFNDEENTPQCFYVVGCLCRLNPDYDQFAEWQHGLGYSRVIDGRVHFTPVNVFDRVFQVEGRTYRY